MAARPHSAVALQVDARGGVTRRRFLLAGAALAGAGLVRPLPSLARELKRQNRACILLWMAGGPSQFETFDPKPGAETQGPTRAIATSVPGLHIAEHWARLAPVM